MFFDKGDYSEHNTFSISELFAHMPIDLLSANFGVPEETFKNIPKKEVYITDSGDPGTLESQTVDSPTGKVPLSYNTSMSFARYRQSKVTEEPFKFLTVAIFLPAKL
ncbi:oxalate decarboxylase [Acetivibrio thermocellus AD2]|jgi:oxalate decarboxylase/phosphoglucose isomerase-like protein (cupin superfamily)|uniref:Oxalate decarboxylase n=1 Tax=Acetivibrio thermocellus AD2 TaxID=1138384 RepID=A0AB36TLC5_ACETH|nr:hypothetical protein [Acetivibrio thermocellus]ALX09333.1 hypothetical protein AD2_02347 [Acetivibrio thermocellus AD2]ANV77087.1 hypothetical protein LQRI_2346 [Acetivibrio thermocellus DSM 2360]EIC04660.1 hypothetical protein YSBL_1634 [Acetivibrio thermocellus YS]PFH03610.1 oxalate decarboxylase [Acetivibrio thermocellus AD2]